MKTLKKEGRAQGLRKVGRTLKVRSSRCMLFTEDYGFIGTRPKNRAARTPAISEKNQTIDMARTTFNLSASTKPRKCAPKSYISPLAAPSEVFSVLFTVSAKSEKKPASFNDATGSAITFDKSPSANKARFTKASDSWSTMY